MKDKEFDLSKTKVDAKEDRLFTYDNYYSEEDVKEFIKRLKIIITNELRYRVSNAMRRNIKEEIDKLAGERLR